MKRHINLRKLIIGTAGMVMGLLLLPGNAAAQGLPTNLPSPPPLIWQPCPDVADRDCAELTVPLDYADLNKGTINLPVSRAQANDATRRHGPLVYNPGGPGQGVAGFIRYTDDANLTRFFSSELIDKFDIIGFDPRGTTNGIACHDTSLEKGAYWEANHLPKTTVEIEAILGLERTANQGCIDNNDPLARHVDTASVVRDMEQLRRAMGVDKFSYMGRSYGTFIGNRYAVLYPGHLRAMVMDAVVDHSVSDQQSFIESAFAYDAAWSKFKAWCQSSPVGTCQLRGQNIDAILNQLLAKARNYPIPAPHSPTGDRPVNDWILTTMLQAVVAPGSVTYGWADKMITDARNGDASLTRLLYDSGSGYAGNGQYFIGGDQHRAIICADTTWAQQMATASQVKAFADIMKNLAPRFGVAGVYQGPVQCHGYPIEPVEAPPVELQVAHQQPPVLIVGATKDATTPLAWAQRIAGKIPGSRLLVREGDGHISYDKSRCIQQKVDRYLVDLVLPAQGTICNTDPDLYPVIPPYELGVSNLSGPSQATAKQVWALTNVRR